MSKEVTKKVSETAEVITDKAASIIKEKLVGKQIDACSHDQEHEETNIFISISFLIPSTFCNLPFRKLINVRFSLFFTFLI